MFRVRDLSRSFIADLDVKVKLGETSAATRAWYKAALDKLDVAAGDFPAADLKAAHLVSVEFTNHFVRVVRALYRWACQEEVGLLTKDPFKRLKPPPCGERNRILSRPEICRLYRASSRALRRLLYMLRHTIARPGEIRQVRWGQIQWAERRIEWRTFKGKKRRRDGLKMRTIALDHSTVRMLRNIYRNRGNPGPAEPVWLDRDGKQWTSNAVRCQMRSARVKAGLDQEGVEERVVCYTLRHTSATDATRAGVQGRTLSSIMGHTNSKTTDRYLHLAGDDLVRGIDQFAAARPPKRDKAG